MAGIAPKAPKILMKRVHERAVLPSRGTEGADRRRMTRRRISALRKWDPRTFFFEDDFQAWRRPNASLAHYRMEHGVRTSIFAVDPGRGFARSHESARENAQTYTQETREFPPIEVTPE